MSDGERGGDEGPRGDRRAEREPAARAGDDQLREQVSELAETLTELETELSGGSRRPQLRDLIRFTREVTIPAVILVLRTNIQALKLLQRALAFGDRGGDGRESRLRRRAEEAGRSALTELDSALEDLGDALSGTQDSRARDLPGCRRHRGRRDRCRRRASVDQGRTRRGRRERGGPRVAETVRGPCGPVS